MGCVQAKQADSTVAEKPLKTLLNTKPLASLETKGKSSSDPTNDDSVLGARSRSSLEVKPRSPVASSNVDAARKVVDIDSGPVVEVDSEAFASCLLPTLGAEADVVEDRGVKGKFLPIDQRMQRDEYGKLLVRSPTGRVLNHSSLVPRAVLLGARAKSSLEVKPSSPVASSNVDVVSNVEITMGPVVEVDSEAFDACLLPTLGAEAATNVVEERSVKANFVPIDQRIQRDAYGRLLVRSPTGSVLHHA